MSSTIQLSGKTPFDEEEDDNNSKATATTVNTTSTSSSSNGTRSNDTTTTDTTASSPVFLLDDADLLYVQQRLDWYNTLAKEDIQARLTSLLNRHSSDKQTIAAQHAAIHQLQRNVDALLAEMQQHRDNSRSTQEAHAQLQQTHQSMITEHVQRELVTRVLHNWRLHVALQKHKHRMVLRYRRLHLLKSWFSEWRGVTHDHKRERDAAYWQRQMDDHRSKVHADHSEELAVLKEEMKEMMVTIRLHNEEKEKHEERLKQAFVRSVCALNREALTVFNPAEIREETQRQEREAGGGAGAAGGPSGVAPMRTSFSASIPVSVSSHIPTTTGDKHTATVVAFQPIPMRLTHPTQPQASTQTQTQSGNGVPRPPRPFVSHTSNTGTTRAAASFASHPLNSQTSSAAARVQTGR